MKKFTPFIPPIQFIFIFTLSVLISCTQPENRTETNASEPAETTHTDEQIDMHLPALYTGTLPCADCPGIDYRLILEKDEFTEISHYQDRSSENFEEAGRWDIDGDTLTLRGEEDLILKRFLIGESNLTLLNRKNERITGDLADMYVLERTGDQESIRNHHQELANKGYAFYAKGNEPFWSLTIDSLNQVIFESPERKLNLGKVDLSTFKNEMRFETSSDSAQFSLQIQDEYCQDSMSGYLFPLTITATMQPSPVDSLKGCGLFFGSTISSNSLGSTQ